jgi:hypothetical protein
VLALGVLEIALLAALGWWPGGRHTPVPALFLFGAAFVAYLVAASLQSRASLPRRYVWWLGLAGRAALLPLLPYFSDDIYRYMWDGWVQLQGVNPFLYAPADEALASIRTVWHPLINHPTVPTIYPPGAQLAFRALAVLGPTIVVFKLAWVACDLGVAWVIDRMTRERQDALPLLLYLWSPLLIVQVAWSGHLEPLALLPLVLACLVDQRAGPPGSDRRAPSRRAGFTAGTLLGLAASVKLAPLAAVPALWRRRGWAAALSSVLVPLLLYALYAGAGPTLFAGLREFADRWEFNAGAYRILEAALGSVQLAKLAAAAVVVAVALEAARRRWTLDRTLLWTIGVALLLSPTVHPWYVLWVLPFAALSRQRAWIALTGLVFLAYWGLGAYRTSGVWRQPDWLPWLIYLPTWALLAHDGLRAQRLSRSGDVSGGEEQGERGQPASGP